MLRHLLIAIGLLILIPLFDANPALAQDRSQVVERLAKGISATDVHKIYIPIFPTLPAIRRGQALSTPRPFPNCFHPNRKALLSWIVSKLTLSC
jgi:hypothetical protein